jgi:hypothetical protein
MSENFYDISASYLRPKYKRKLQSADALNVRSRVDLIWAWAIWDNRSTAHLAPRDIFQSDFDRQLYRITLVGEPLVGVDGRTSTSIEGLPVLSASEELRLIVAAE